MFFNSVVELRLIKAGRKIKKAIIFFIKLISIDLYVLVCARQIKHAYVQDVAAPKAERIPIKTNNFKKFYFINWVNAKKIT